MTQKQIGLNLAGLLALILVFAGWYWQSTGPRAVPGLTDSLRSERVDFRVAAANALAAIGPAARPAVPALLAQALRDPNSNASTAAAGALAKIDLTAAREVMAVHLPRLKSGDALTRRTACEVLASLGPLAKPAVPHLREALADEDDVVRNRAVSALGAIGLPTGQVVPALLSALEDPAAAVRYTTVLQFSFGQTPDEAIPALTQRLADSDRSVAQLAKSALTGARREQMANVPVLILMLQTSPAREYTLLQLAKLGPAAAEAAAALIPILSDPQALNRYLAAEALGAIGPAAEIARPGLTAALEDEEVVVRESAAWALEAIAAPRDPSQAKAPR